MPRQPRRLKVPRWIPSAARAIEAEWERYSAFPNPNRAALLAALIRFATQDAITLRRLSPRAARPAIGRQPPRRSPRAVGYVSGNSLSDTATYDNTTISGLGLSPGTYIWMWGTGADQGTFELEIDETPLPAALPLFATGLGGLGLLGWRRKRKSRISLLG